MDVETRVDNGRLLAQLACHGEVLSKRYTDTRVIVHCRIPERALGNLRYADTQIRPHGKTPSAASNGDEPSWNGNGKGGHAKPSTSGDANGSANGKKHG